MWQELEEVAVVTQRKFYEKYSNPADWTSSAIDEWVSLKLLTKSR